MKIRARGCTEQRDTQAFSPTTCFSKLYLVCGPPLGPWHWSHCFKIFKIKIKNQVQIFQQDHLWLLGFSDANQMEAVWKAPVCTFTMPAKLMSLMSATLWCRSVELLTILGRICCQKIEDGKCWMFWILEEALEQHHHFASSFFKFSFYVTFNF